MWVTKMAQNFIPIYQDEPARDWVDDEGTTYRRTGYCCHCGQCCQSDVDTGGDQPCHFLQTDDQGVLNCTGRGTESYLRGCDSFPTVPGHIEAYPGCTYRIEVIPAEPT